MIIISPSKNLNLQNEFLDFETTSPSFLIETKEIVKKVKKLNFIETKSLMNVSESLAKLNFERFKVFYDKTNVRKPAAFIFSGDTFTGLSIRSFDKTSLNFAQKNLRILSGLYGILRPYDEIEPYRLEMGTKINKILGSSLYDFWKDKISNKLSEEIKQTKSRFLFNLASEEYCSALNFKIVNCKIISFDFKKLKNGKLSGIGMMIKKLRGEMARYIIFNKINSLEKLEKFTSLGFRFSKFDKLNNKLLFISK